MEQVHEKKPGTLSRIGRENQQGGGGRPQQPGGCMATEENTVHDTKKYNSGNPSDWWLFERQPADQVVGGLLEPHHFFSEISEEKNLQNISIH